MLETSLVVSFDIFEFCLMECSETSEKQLNTRAVQKPRLNREISIDSIISGSIHSLGTFATPMYKDSRNIWME